ncbi:MULTISPECIES: ABC-2 family transporter protein [Carboxydocella]|uniref:ABC-2 type transport system permease protein n=2 Tax=Carboxydocella TaxID=178898 RepID=A0A1T4N5K6_9FIRM|nr:MULTISPECIES: ABC-2 family transporter protein [Carboxydocella]AVX20915.1 ABC-2 type transport system permease protein [Carboxydocella thermautotrophica]AVX31330.1 ABC-2 type transport system permease protein [Carboxydocella thermautotrophica]SJZ74503.1 ABC-2 type transport system permease protein [Carboxydocella sporoproducens DSM 16521]GAW29923.1 protein of unknown function DUF990 [Carboxydocella sp. ULO1]GAW30475.1 protein of unknown function DUF990 [Carboxydocella sp. JDF658]
MRIYLTLIRMEFMKQLAYRVSNLTGVLNYLVQIGGYFFLWDAIYAARRPLAGFTHSEMLSYVIVAWVVRSFYFNNLEREIALEVREGRIVLELLRPYDYGAVKLARALGEALFRLLVFTLPSGLVMYLFYPFKLPSSLTAWGMFLLAALGSFLVNAQLNLLTGYLTFYTYNNTGIQRMKRVLVDLLSGLLVPISFYPAWAQQIIDFLPFRSISYLPTLIWLGKISPAAGWQVLAEQVLWFLVLAFISRLLWQRALKGLMIQGG